MTRGDFGVWEVKLLAHDGKPAIPHNSKVKVSINETFSKAHVIQTVF